MSVLSRRLVLLGSMVALLALFLTWGQERGNAALGLEERVLNGETVVRSVEFEVPAATLEAESQTPDLRSVERTIVPDERDRLLASLCPIDAILLDRARLEPVPFLDVEIFDTHGVTVRARSDARGRVVSREVLPRGDVVVVLRSGPALPEWYIRGGSRRRWTDSPPGFCRFESRHGIDDARADVWLVDSSRLVPVRLKGVPETKPEILCFTDADRSSAVFEISTFDDPELPFWKGATHVVALRSARIIDTANDFKPVLRDMTGRDFGPNADAPARVVNMAPWSAEFASHMTGRPKAALFTETASLMRAGTVQAETLPNIGDEPFTVTLEPLLRGHEEQLERRFGSLAGWAKTKILDRRAQMAVEQQKEFDEDAAESPR